MQTRACLPNDELEWGLHTKHKNDLLFTKGISLTTLE